MKFSKKNFITFILCFIILLYPFNSTIKSRLFPNEIFIFLLSAISIVLLFFLSFGKSKKILKKQLVVFLITLLILGIELYRNYYFKESSEAKVFFFSAYLFIPFVLSFNKIATENFIKATRLFCYEHVFGTFFVQIFKDFYISNILPWLSNGKSSVAFSNLKNGYNPGFTMHYSTNGMYLSIAVILFFSQYLENKKKKDLILTILSMIALLLTGKRAHTLFTIFACIALYLFKYKDYISKKVISFISIIFASIIGIFVLSMFMPQVLNVIDRFESTIEKGELLSGREPFYELALDLWKDHKIFGNGWGSFSYYFQLRLYSPVFTYGYLDGHNVYLQLLCETGIVGAIFFVWLAIKILLDNSKLINKINRNNGLLLFSFAYQIYFLLYCFSGNPLYDIQAYAVYFICIGIVLNNKYHGESIGVKEEEKNEKV